MPAVANILQPNTLNYKIVRHLVQNIEGEPMFDAVFESVSNSMTNDIGEYEPVVSDYLQAISNRMNAHLSYDLDHMVNFLINEFLPQVTEDDDENWYSVPLTSLIARLELFERSADGIVGGVDYADPAKIGQYLKSQNKTEREFGIFLLSLTPTI